MDVRFPSHRQPVYFSQSTFLCAKFLKTMEQTFHLFLHTTLSKTGNTKQCLIRTSKTILTNHATRLKRASHVLRPRRGVGESGGSGDAPASRPVVINCRRLSGKVLSEFLWLSFLPRFYCLRQLFFGTSNQTVRLKPDQIRKRVTPRTKRIPMEPVWCTCPGRSRTVRLSVAFLKGCS